MSQTPLTDRQAEIYEFIRSEIETKRIPPTVREICLRFDIASPNGAMCHLNALEAKGWIKRDAKLSRSITLVGEQGSEYRQLLIDDNERLTKENEQLMKENARLNSCVKQPFSFVDHPDDEDD